MQLILVLESTFQVAKCVLCCKVRSRLQSTFWDTTICTAKQLCMLRIDGSYINITLRLFRLVYWEGKMHSSSVATNRYTRVPNITGVPNKSISRVFLLRQLWIVNFYVKSLSNNLSNKNKTLQRNDITKIVTFSILNHVLS